MVHILLKVMILKYLLEKYSKNVPSCSKKNDHNIRMDSYNSSEGEEFKTISNPKKIILTKRKINQEKVGNYYTNSNYELFLFYFEEYIIDLKLVDGTPVILSNRRTGFIGFIICLNNIVNLYNYCKDKIDLEYFLNYKVSQDFLKIFFVPFAVDTFL